MPLSTDRQTANVVYDPSVTSVEELRRWVTDCGFHCAGQSVPDHICDPLMEPDSAAAEGAAEMPPAEVAAPEAPAAPDDAMGHGGHAGC